jgi:hypothetical protein
MGITTRRAIDSVLVKGAKSMMQPNAKRDKEEIRWSKPGVDEREIFICDQELFNTSPWLREKQFFGSVLMFQESFPSLRIAAVSINRNGEERGRVWYLRRTDRFDLPCPTEAVIPSTIRVNGQSTPYFVILQQINEQRNTKQ